MATIRTYTTIEQSRKLAKFMPLESADMVWEQHGAEPYVTIKPWTTIGKSIGCHCLSCWSLAALLSVLPNASILLKGFDKIYDLTNSSGEIARADNPIDACYEMIIKLN